MFDVFLYFLNPLEADAGRTHNQSCSRLNLGFLDPAVGTEIFSPTTRNSNLYSLEVSLNSNFSHFETELLLIMKMLSWEIDKVHVELI